MEIEMPYKPRQYKVGQQLYEYRMELLRYPDEDPQAAGLDMWTITRLARKHDVLTVYLALDGKPYIKTDFAIGTSKPNGNEERFATTQHGAYLAAVSEIKAAIKRLSRMLKAAEKKAAQTGQAAKREVKAAKERKTAAKVAKET